MGRNPIHLQSLQSTRPSASVATAVGGSHFTSVWGTAHLMRRKLTPGMRLAAASTMQGAQETQRAVARARYEEARALFEPALQDRRDNATPKIEVRSLSAWYGDTRVLRDVSLAVPASTVLAIIGPSGCGKSTFLRCLNRMHELVPGARQSGIVLLDEQDVNARGVDPVRLRAHVGMVFQRPSVFPTMSIFDNAVAGLRLNGIRGDYATLVEKSLRQAAFWSEVDCARAPCRGPSDSSNACASHARLPSGPRCC